MSFRCPAQLSKALVLEILGLVSEGWVRSLWLVPRWVCWENHQSPFPRGQWSVVRMGCQAPSMKQKGQGCG